MSGVVKVTYVLMGLTTIFYAGLGFFAPDLTMNNYGPQQKCAAAYTNLEVVSASSLFMGVILLQAAFMNAGAQKAVALALIPYGLGVAYSVRDLVGQTSYSYFGFALSAFPSIIGVLFRFVLNLSEKQKAQ